MKILLLTILFLISIKVFGPEVRRFYIEKAKAISRFDNLVDAVSWVESRHGLYVWNPTEGAVGWLQIRKCRIDDYNNRMGSHYKLSDCYDYELSRKIFIFFAEGKSFEKAARDWNGSGKQTEVYWDKVKSYLR